MMESKIQEIESAQLRTGLPTSASATPSACTTESSRATRSARRSSRASSSSDTAPARAAPSRCAKSASASASSASSVHSPRIEKVEVVSRGVVRRARLFYLRELPARLRACAIEGRLNRGRTAGLPRTASRAATRRSSAAAELDALADVRADEREQDADPREDQVEKSGIVRTVWLSTSRMVVGIATSGWRRQAR